MRKKYTNFLEGRLTKYTKFIKDVYVYNCDPLLGISIKKVIRKSINI